MNYAVKDIQFNQYNVSNKTTKVKARVFYSLDNRADERKCVTLYAKDYGHALRDVIPDAYQNDTETGTDYFDEGRAVLFEGHRLYAVARAFVESLFEKRKRKDVEEVCEAYTYREDVEDGRVMFKGYLHSEVGSRISR